MNKIDYSKFKETRDVASMVGNQVTRKYYVADRYFQIANINTYYYAGFIHGDGCISSPIPGHGNNSRLIIEISQKDKSLLEALKAAMFAQQPIKTRIDDRPRYKNGPSITERIEIGSNEMCNDLTYYFNVIPVKSLIVEPPPLEINWYNMPLIILFIRGLVDANGSVGINKQFPEKLNRIRLVSASKKLIDWIHHIVYKWWLPNIPARDVRIEVKGNNRKNSYHLELNGLRAATVYNILFSAPAPYVMKRKWKVGIQDLSNFRTIKSSPTTPKYPYTNDYKPNPSIACDHHGYFIDKEDLGDPNSNNSISPIDNVPDKNGYYWQDHYSKEYYQENTFGPDDSIDWHLKQQFNLTE